ncbi:MAG TPA: hypothetical protein VGP23_06050 [Candidatus Binataceae bacterium]|jgi:hypothetical protein|nr:hypothetical protein [Candidatus Binataceae bacterium]
MLALTGTSGALRGAAVLGGVGHSYAYPALCAMIIAHTPAGASEIRPDVCDRGPGVGRRGRVF